MLRKLIYLSLSGLIMSFMAASSCSSKTSSLTEVASEKLAPAEPVRQQWQAEWERITKEARREGKLVLPTSGGMELAPALAKVMQDRYGLKLEFIAGRGGEITQRLFTERRAGIFTFDIYMGGTSTFVDELKPAKVLDNLESQLLLPEVLDPKLWWNGEVPFVDKDRLFLAFLAYPLSPLIINTGLVKNEELKSYWDMINPKWKGKIIMDDPLTLGTGQGTFTVLSYVLLNQDFYRQLARMDPVITRDRRQLVDWVAKGKSAIGFAPLMQTVSEFIRAGAPIKSVTPVEGTYISSGPGNIGVVNKAPHPNAARVFINWLLTKEGGTLYSEVSGNQSARIDVSTNHMDPMLVRQPEVKYFNYIDEEFLLKKTEQLKLAKEIFGLEGVR